MEEDLLQPSPFAATVCDLKVQSAELDAALEDCLGRRLVEIHVPPLKKNQGQSAAEPGRNFVIMQDLPDDVIPLILNKLAVQDPIYLLRFLHVSKAFQRVATENNSIWKNIFCGPALLQCEKRNDKAFFEQQSARLDADLESSHMAKNFKKLAQATWIKQSVQKRGQLWGSQHALDGIGYDSAQLLSVISLRGSVISWSSQNFGDQPGSKRLQPVTEGSNPLLQPPEVQFLYPPEILQSLCQDASRDSFRMEVHASLLQHVGHAQTRHVGFVFWRGKLASRWISPREVEVVSRVTGVPSKAVVNCRVFSAELPAVSQQPRSAFNFKALRANFVLITEAVEQNKPPQTSAYLKIY